MRDSLYARLEGTSVTDTPAPDVAALAALHVAQRVPDPAHIAKLPKPTRKTNEKARCNECGGWHGMPAVHLDYCGHAEVTDILLAADPLWTWEPLSVGPDGTPVVIFRDGTAVMWIRLTVHGHTRPGVGTAPAGKDELEKELIGDALRNAAMRFGVGTSLWSKAEGVERQVEADLPVLASRDHLAAIEAALAGLKDDARGEVKGWWTQQGFPPLRSGRLTEPQAETILDHFDGIARSVAADGPPEPATDDGPPDGLGAPESGTGASEDGIPSSPPAGDVAGWLIARAAAMNAVSLRASLRAGGGKAPAGGIEVLRQAWAIDQMEQLARGTCWAVGGGAVEVEGLAFIRGES